MDARVAGCATALPHPVGMNKREWLPRREWARREMAKIDALLLAPKPYEQNWRQYRRSEAGRDRLHARRARLARVAGMDFDDGPTPF